MITRAVWASLAVASAHISEVHPNGHICPATPRLSKGGFSQASLLPKSAWESLDLAEAVLWGHHHSSHLDGPVQAEKGQALLEHPCAIGRATAEHSLHWVQSIWSLSFLTWSFSCCCGNALRCPSNHGLLDATGPLLFSASAAS